MKKSYLFKKNLTRIIRQGLDGHKTTRALSLVLFFALLTQFSLAQTSLNWTGLVDSDANKSVNWDPQYPPYGNILTIDSAYKFTNQPILYVDSTSAINELIKNYRSWLKVTVAEGITLDINGKNKNLYPHGELYKDGPGLFTVRSNVYIKENEDSVFVSDGTFEVRSALLMGNANTATEGGYLFISGTGRVHCKGFPFRFTYPDTTMSLITITDDASLTVAGDFSVIADSLANATHQIRSTPDRDIVIKFDPIANLTTIYSRDKMEFLVEPAEHQYLAAGEQGDIIRIVKNDGLASMNSLVWKYTTTPGSGYTNFPTAQTGDTLIPSFPGSGVYFVMCIGDNGTTTDTTNVVTFIVSSDKVSISPDGLQVVKIGQTPVPLIVTETETATSREWLYTTIPGESYQSFDPAITDTFCAPLFKEVGEYYIMCRSVISGSNEQSSEVQINVTDSSTYADLRWKGTVSTDASDPLNWSPYAQLHKNNLIFDTSDYKTNEPVLTAPGNDTIGEIDIRAGASFTINIPEGDTIFEKSSSADWLYGTFFIKSGVFYDKVYFHIKDKTGILDISGGVFTSDWDLLVGNGNVATAGGYVNIHGTGVIDVPGVDRFCATDTTQSVITIWDDGKLITHDNDTALAKGWVEKNQLKTLDGWELVISYNPSDTTTIITAFDPNAIYVTPKTKQTLAIDEPASVLSASNTAIYDSLIWKYSTSVGGDLIAFEPAVHDTFATPSFSKAGTFYVVCVGMNDTLTKVSNAIQILVPSVTVAPADKQVVIFGIASGELEVTEAPEADSRKWKYSQTSGGGYTLPQIGYTNKVFALNLPTTGTYYIICESTFGTKVIQSNEVEVEVVDLQISPSVKQEIVKNTDGKTITVTETGSVDSREWMYTTTSGEGYVSFDPAQTSTDYTPNFPQAGTYYVVCASVFSGVTFYSNEVTIIVKENSGVDNTDINNLAVYPNPTTGKFVVHEENMGIYRIDVYNSQGKMILSKKFSGNEGAQEFMLDKKGIYVVNLVAQDYMKTTKLIVE